MAFLNPFRVEPDGWDGAAIGLSKKGTTILATRLNPTAEDTYSTVNSPPYEMACIKLATAAVRKYWWTVGWRHTASTRSSDDFPAF